MARAMKIKEEITPPTCEASLSLETRKFWKSRGRHGNRKGTDHCGNFAKYFIMGKFYCGKHGATAALKILLEEK